MRWLVALGAVLALAGPVPAQRLGQYTPRLRLAYTSDAGLNGVLQTFDAAVLNVLASDLGALRPQYPTTLWCNDCVLGSVPCTSAAPVLGGAMATWDVANTRWSCVLGVAAIQGSGGGATTITSSATTARTWNLPNTSDTFVGLTSAQLLQSKTIQAPTITGLQTFGDGSNVVLGTSLGTKWGTDNSVQKQAWFNATPTNPTAEGTTADLRQLLIDYGFLLSGGATPLNLNGGALTASGGVTGGAGSFDSLFVAANAATIGGQLVTTPVTVSLTADNQNVLLTKSLVSLSSDNATATNRTFTLQAPSAAGQRVTLAWTNTNAGELVDDSANIGGGNVRLASTWTPTQYDTLTLVAVGSDWYEVGRSTN